MAATPAALQLRLLQTVVAVAAEKNSTLVLPFPVELLRFLERAQQPVAATPEQQVPAPPPPSAVTGEQSVQEQLPAAAIDLESEPEGSNSRQD
jgi:hypothetical protein